MSMCVYGNTGPASVSWWVCAVSAVGGCSQGAGLGGVSEAAGLEVSPWELQRDVHSPRESPAAEPQSWTVAGVHLPALSSDLNVSPAAEIVQTEQRLPFEVPS